jgi:hypothetical protein
MVDAVRFQMGFEVSRQALVHSKSLTTLAPWRGFTAV